MSDKKQRKILIVDDSQINLTLLKAHLTKMGLMAMTSDNAATAIKMAIEEQPDVILLDVMMPDMNGYEACKILKEDSRTSMIPVIFISAKDQVDDKIAGLESGAIDYITKPFNKGELRARVNIVLQMIELQEKLMSLANTDELTGLANRRCFFEMLEHNILQSRIKGDTLAAVMLDIDHFKSVNDTYGHQAGDAILKQFADIIKKNIYPLDIAARYGGEEFIIIMPDTSYENALQATHKLHKIIGSNKWQISDKQISITASIGLAALKPSNPITSKELIKRADTALYAAKQQGRNRVIEWEDIGTKEVIKTAKSEDLNELTSKINSLSQQLHSQTIGLISSFSKVMSLKDKYMKNHAENVQSYAIAIAEEMNMSAEFKKKLSIASFLHDIGKITTPNEILYKKTPLTKKEKQLIEYHPITAVKILEPTSIFDQELEMIRHHHENFDGTGYPDRLKEKEISIGARILAVASAFDAMTSKRGHRDAHSNEYAISEIKNCAGTQFDPDVVEAFIETSKENSDKWPLSAKNKAASDSKPLLV